MGPNRTGIDAVGVTLVAGLPAVRPAGEARNVLREMRVRALYSPYYFIRVILGYRKLVAHLHNHDLELFVTRWAAGVLKQFIEWPRAFFKTTTFTIGVGMWHILPVSQQDTDYACGVLGMDEDVWFTRVGLHDQDATQLYAFETELNARKKIEVVRAHFEDNDTFRNLWPEIMPTARCTWTTSCLTIPRVGARRRDAEGTFEAKGVGGALQSRHYKTIWEDDLIGEKARDSRDVMAKTIGWHERLAGAFESGARQNRFGISNRWGYADLNSHIRANELDFVFYTRSAWELDTNPDSPTFGQDVAIFPEEYPMEVLLKIRDGFANRDGSAMTPYDFTCQYLNQPTMPGEREVDAAKVHTYDVDEQGVMVCSCGARWRLSQCNRYLHYDPYNAKGSSSTSCPALVLVACAPDQHVFVVSYFTTRSAYSKIFDRIFWYNDTFRPKLFTFEDVGHQNAIAYHIRTLALTSDYKAEHKNFCRIEGVSTGNRSKEARIREGLFPAIVKKKFSVRSTHRELLTQLDTFPHAVLAHDYDLLDALAQGVQLWRFPMPDENTATELEREEEYLRALNQPFSHAGTLLHRGARS